MLHQEFDEFDGVNVEMEQLRNRNNELEEKVKNMTKDYLGLKQLILSTDKLIRMLKDEKLKNQQLEQSKATLIASYKELQEEFYKVSTDHKAMLLNKRPMEEENERVQAEAYKIINSRVSDELIIKQLKESDDQGKKEIAKLKAEILILNKKIKNYEKNSYGGSIWNSKTSKSKNEEEETSDSDFSMDDVDDGHFVIHKAKISNRLSNNSQIINPSPSNLLSQQNSLQNKIPIELESASKASPKNKKTVKPKKKEVSKKNKKSKDNEAEDVAKLLESYMTNDCEDSDGSPMKENKSTNVAKDGKGKPSSGKSPKPKDKLLPESPRLGSTKKNIKGIKVNNKENHTTNKKDLKQANSLHSTSVVQDFDDIIGDSNTDKTQQKIQPLINKTSKSAISSDEEDDIIGDSNTDKTQKKIQPLINKTSKSAISSDEEYDFDDVPDFMDNSSSASKDFDKPADINLKKRNNNNDAGNNDKKTEDLFVTPKKINDTLKNSDTNTSSYNKNTPSKVISHYSQSVASEDEIASGDIFDFDEPVGSDLGGSKVTRETESTNVYVENSSLKSLQLSEDEDEDFEGTSNASVGGGVDGEKARGPHTEELVASGENTENNTQCCRTNEEIIAIDDGSISTRDVEKAENEIVNEEDGPNDDKILEKQMTCRMLLDEMEMSSDEEEDEQSINDPSKYIDQAIPPEPLTDWDVAPDTTADQCTFEDNRSTTCGRTDLKCDQLEEGEGNLDREAPESTFEQKDGKSEIMTENVIGAKDEVMSEEDDDALIVDEIVTQIIVIQPLEVTGNVREEFSNEEDNLIGKCSQTSHEDNSFIEEAFIESDDESIQVGDVDNDKVKEAADDGVLVTDEVAMDDDVLAIKETEEQTQPSEDSVLDYFVSQTKNLESDEKIVISEDTKSETIIVRDTETIATKESITNVEASKNMSCQEMLLSETITSQEMLLSETITSQEILSEVIINDKAASENSISKVGETECNTSRMVSDSTDEQIDQVKDANQLGYEIASSSSFVSPDASFEENIDECKVVDDSNERKSEKANRILEDTPMHTENKVSSSITRVSEETSGVSQMMDNIFGRQGEKNNEYQENTTPDILDDDLLISSDEEELSPVKSVESQPKKPTIQKRSLVDNILSSMNDAMEMPQKKEFVNNSQNRNETVNRNKRCHSPDTNISNNKRIKVSKDKTPASVNKAGTQERINVNNTAFNAVSNSAKCDRVLPREEFQKLKPDEISSLLELPKMLSPLCSPRYQGKDVEISAEKSKINNFTNTNPSSVKDRTKMMEKQNDTKQNPTNSIKRRSPDDSVKIMPSSKRPNISKNVDDCNTNGSLKNNKINDTLQNKSQDINASNPNGLVKQINNLADKHQARTNAIKNSNQMMPMPVSSTDEISKFKKPQGIPRGSSGIMKEDKEQEFKRNVGMESTVGCIPTNKSNATQPALRNGNTKMTQNNIIDCQNHVTMKKEKVISQPCNSLNTPSPKPIRVKEDIVKKINNTNNDTIKTDKKVVLNGAPVSSLNKVPARVDAFKKSNKCQRVTTSKTFTGMFLKIMENVNQPVTSFVSAFKEQNISDRDFTKASIQALMSSNRQLKNEWLLKCRQNENSHINPFIPSSVSRAVEFIRLCSCFHAKGEINLMELFIKESLNLIIRFTPANKLDESSIVSLCCAAVAILRTQG